MNLTHSWQVILKIMRILKPTITKSKTKIKKEKENKKKKRKENKKVSKTGK